jgi:hypothetical protein
MQELIIIIIIIIIDIVGQIAHHLFEGGKFSIMSLYCLTKSLAMSSFFIFQTWGLGFRV